ncbi:hypothetical protein BEWA_001590 [Theileria equi strain WA]|uniref:Uncharacterized protein n=1 Tax=Theileria equi strain WA TaxID=1537102 RepID=L0AYS8_THEEQ|nr:hypothetical protein BEWA_001590 [Theileria equi strain WA]AFZ80752.1 hypothetical protein BEWA_001590 [Theileria equi strain WA]|eukprot:XP_004830418.1 hypothetical protein BEWA_001590 [Theileria equi strain WA]
MTEDQGITIKLLQKPKDKGDPPTTYNGDESPGGTPILCRMEEDNLNYLQY